jgi:hypothetical protein
MSNGKIQKPAGSNHLNKTHKSSNFHAYAYIPDAKIRTVEAMARARHRAPEGVGQVAQRRLSKSAHCSISGRQEAASLQKSMAAILALQ